MPILTLTAVAADESTVDRVLARVVRDVATALECPIGDVWASYVAAAAQHIGARRATRRDQCPTVVIRGRARRADLVGAALAAAAVAVSDEFGLPVEDVWLQWIDVVPGRAYAGGGPI